MKSTKKTPESLRKLLKSDPFVRVRYDSQTEAVRNLRGQLAKVGTGASALRSGGIRFIKAHKDLFGAPNVDGMKVLVEARDPNGGTTVVLQQYHKGVPIHGGSVRFHADNKGVIDTISNRLVTDLARTPYKASVSMEKAVQAAQKHRKCKTEPSQKPELLVYRFEKKPHLTWKIRLEDTKKGERGVPAIWVVFVDATNGKVIDFYDDAQTAGPVALSGTGYYSGAGTVNAWFNDVTNQLRDTTRTGGGGPEIATNDEDGASPSEDADGNWDDATVVPRDQNQGAEVDAHRYAAAVADYYTTVHGRNSYDDAGATMTVLSHYGTDLDNGYWDGTRVKLGDGSGASPGFDYCCSDDWLAHEFTHAYTANTCALQYSYESGALNEGFSDVFAAFITGDWYVFEDTWLNPSAPAARNMIDPTNGGQWDVTDPITSVLAGHQPSHYDDRYTGASDYGGVHINSGIINNLFYLLTVGGTHTTSGITVTGVGQSAAEQMLFRCMTVNLVGNPTADFLDFREAMLDACQDLFPTDLNMLTQVKNAFNAVGIGPDLYVRDNTADTGEEPYGGTYLWASPDIINRTALSADPSTDFADMTDGSLWENVEYGQDNYVYIRVQNRGNADGDVAINVYFSSASTFGTPASWIHIGTLNEAAIAPGAVRVSGPLTFPSALIPAVGHYCMIAVISDALDPAPDHTLIASVSDYLDFVRNSNNIAYRNMDVVDLIPGAPGAAESEVRNMPGMRERFDLRVDLGKFVPGAIVKVMGPARALQGAIPRGLKLQARKKDMNIYEVLQGKALNKHLAFLNMNAADREMAIGFDNVLVERPFRLKVEYSLPDQRTLDMAKRFAPKNGYELKIRQLWNGEPVGAVGLNFVEPKQRIQIKPKKTIKAKAVKKTVRKVKKTVRKRK